MSMLGKTVQIPPDRRLARVLASRDPETGAVTWVKDTPIAPGVRAYGNIGGNYYEDDGATICTQVIYLVRGVEWHCWVKESEMEVV